MTAEEKKMKKYTNGVERRLNLPREVKTRVMSDFISSIAARREAGMSDEEIYQELGNPKKAAADLNEQMKEFAYRKSPWRFLCLAAAIYSGGRLLSQAIAAVLLLMMRMAQQGNAATIGIIGGADGPTAIFVTSRPDPIPEFVWVLVLIAGIWGFLRLKKCKKERRA